MKRMTRQKARRIIQLVSQSIENGTTMPLFMQHDLRELNEAWRQCRAPETMRDLLMLITGRTRVPDTVRYIYRTNCQPVSDEDPLWYVAIRYRRKPWRRLRRHTPNLTTAILNVPRCVAA